MKPFPHVLVVEDEAAIAELIAVNLRHNGFTPIWAEDAEAAQRELDAVLPDVILLDWMLPGMSGLQLARQWRSAARTRGVPSLMLTTTSPSPSPPRSCSRAYAPCCAAGRRSRWPTASPSAR